MQGRDQMGVLVGAEDSESSRVGETAKRVDCGFKVTSANWKRVNKNDLIEGKGGGGVRKKTRRQKWKRKCQ